MRIEVIRSSREPLYAQIARQVRAAIVSDEFTPGCRLPSHQEVGRVLGVSTATVRRAYSELEHAALVTIEDGTGTYVAETLTPAASPHHARRRLASLVDALMVEAGRGGLTLEEIFEELEWSAGRHGLQRGDNMTCRGRAGAVDSPPSCPAEAGDSATQAVDSPSRPSGPAEAGDDATEVVALPYRPSGEDGVKEGVGDWTEVHI